MIQACRHPIHHQLRKVALHGLRRYGTAAAPLGFVFDIVRILVLSKYGRHLQLATGWRPYQRTECSSCCQESPEHARGQQPTPDVSILFILNTLKE